ncbi:HAD family hydrolase [Occultella kanbiaonis]|uniref:HAD family hydrolase n=1 Tax=Occultella kanbiaonis TaxID=2675754 RepID=UPI0013D3A3BF|nr:HAD-IA family hydrolase [Occultella kanbiaonis]
MTGPEPSPTGPAVAAVLWDADGVLQDLPGGWVGAMGQIVSERTEEFLRDAWCAERPTLAGDGDWPDLLGEVVARWGLQHAYDDILGVWSQMEGSAESLALVAQVRAAGLRCVLATNQDRHRARVMEARFDYGSRFDATYYSAQVGAAKPDHAYFRHVVDDLGLTPAEALLIDDNARNVEAARHVGLRAVQWTIGEGHEVLRGHLHRHAVLPASS